MLRKLVLGTSLVALALPFACESNAGRKKPHGLSDGGTNDGSGGGDATIEAGGAGAMNSSAGAPTGDGATGGAPDTMSSGGSGGGQATTSGGDGSSAGGEDTSSGGTDTTSSGGAGGGGSAIVGMLYAPGNPTELWGYSITSEGTLEYADLDATVPGDDYSVSTAPLTGLATAATPGGDFIYVIGSTNPTQVAGFAIGAEGTLARLDADTGSGGIQDFQLVGQVGRDAVIDPTGAYLYVVSQNDTIDVLGIGGDGLLSAVDTTTTGTTPYGIAMSADGTQLFTAEYGDDTVSSFSVSAVDGTLTPEDAYPVDAGPIQVAAHPTLPVVYVTSLDSDSVTALTYNGLGQFTTLGAVDTGPVDPTGSAPIGVAVHPNGDFVYVACNGTNTLNSYSVDGTGALTALDANDSTVGSSRALTMAPSGNFLYLNNDGSSLVPFSIDSGTGAVSALASISGPFGSYKNAWVALP
jgi:6-phosphogluconolactonase (cycloisomerase 2 family)